MEIKDIIRKRREELNLTYEQLGNMIGVGKSTVRKWETGMIENMRRDNIVALAKALDISPAIIMGWENPKELTQTDLSHDEATLLDNYNKLNDIGKKEANKRVAELTCISMYSNSEITATTDKSEKILDSMYDTIAAHDDNLTPDEKEEMNRRILDKLNKLHKDK